jgi:hypothetical protein
MNALAYIAEKRFESLSAVYMVAVPCSKPWIESTMKRSIHRIAALSSDGAVELFTKCSIPFIDAADLIIRIDPVDTSHFIGTGGERPGYKEHLASMMIQGRKAD